MADQRFVQIEQYYDRLKAELYAGRLSAEAFERALWDAMFESHGRFWMLGANSRRWYVSDGYGWIESSPPAPVGTAEPVSPPGPIAAQPSNRSMLARVLAVLVLVGVVAFAVFCFRTGYQAWTGGDRIGGGIAIGFGLLLVGAMVSGAIGRTRH